MTVRGIIILAALATLLGALQPIWSLESAAQRKKRQPRIELPEKQPPRLELPERKPKADGAADTALSPEDDAATDDNAADESEAEAPAEAEDEGLVAFPQKSGDPDKFRDPADHLGNDADDDKEEDPRQDLATDADDGASDGEDGVPPVPGRKNIVPAGPPAPPPSWTEDEIKEANAQCRVLLAGTRYDYESLEPIKDGVCGDPAPILLQGLNGTPKVTINPPATINCSIAERLNRWMTEVVQPQAQKLLDDKIVRLVNLSGYVCRRRYNSPGQKMSHHAFANAIDLGEFITEKGEEISVLKHWPGDDKRAEFLKAIHKGACGIFGTVLGPLANSAHANHFHFDGAKRRHSAYCQ